MRTSSRRYSRRKMGSVSCSSTRGLLSLVDTTRRAYSAAGLGRQFCAPRVPLDAHIVGEFLPLRGLFSMWSHRRLTAPHGAFDSNAVAIGSKWERPVGDTTPPRRHGQKSGGTPETERLSVGAEGKRAARRHDAPPRAQSGFVGGMIGPSAGSDGSFGGRVTLTGCFSEQRTPLRRLLATFTGSWPRSNDAAPRAAAP